MRTPRRFSALLIDFFFARYIHIESRASGAAFQTLADGIRYFAESPCAISQLIFRGFFSLFLENLLAHNFFASAEAFAGRQAFAPPRHEAAALEFTGYIDTLRRAAHD